MKVASCLVLALSLAVAERQAPYLPSGWKPAGPAFLLPSEAQKPADNPLANHIEVEASGSDFLREYGPPAVSQVSQEITKQALPEISTEQSFAVEAADARTKEAVAVESKANGAENRAQVDEVAVGTKEEGAVSSEANAADNSAQVKEVVQGKGDSDSEASQQQQDVAVNEVAEVKEEQQEQHVEAELKTLEQEINSKQVSQESEVQTIQQEAGVPADSPAGFLEYGPPAGHTEYGPPKQYEAPALRAALVNRDPADETTVAATTDAITGQVYSETRRRRFSPRLWPVQRIH